LLPPGGGAVAETPGICVRPKTQDTRNFPAGFPVRRVGGVRPTGLAADLYSCETAVFLLVRDRSLFARAGPWSSTPVKNVRAGLPVTTYRCICPGPDLDECTVDNLDSCPLHSTPNCGIIKTSKDHSHGDIVPETSTGRSCSKAKDSVHVPLAGTGPGIRDRRQGAKWKRSHPSHSYNSQRPGLAAEKGGATHQDRQIASREQVPALGPGHQVVTTALNDQGTIQGGTV
jgi:hypothetical protein